MRLSELHDQLGEHLVDPDAPETMHEIRELPER
jgi:hypothetical protein